MQISRAPHTPDPQLLTDIQAKIDALFARCAMLCGFSIQDRAMLPIQLDDRAIPDADLFITEIGIYPKLNADPQREMFDEVTLLFSERMDAEARARRVLPRGPAAPLRQ